MPTPAPPSAQNDAIDTIIAPVSTHRVAVTFYACPPFCGTMASGATVYEGAAACGYAWPLGTRFTLEGDPTGRTYACEDRGLGPWLWVDIFFWNDGDGYAWQASVGTLATARLQP